MATVDNRAPALADSVKVDTIASEFSVSTKQLDGARERLFTDVKFTDTFDSSYTGWQGTASKVLQVVAFVVTLGGLGIWAASKVSSVNSQNAARELVRNPQDFTKAIHMLNHEEIKAEDASKGIHTQEGVRPTNGTKAAQTKEHSQTMDALEKYSGKTLAQLDNAIDKIVADLPKGKQKDTRRALYAALAAQASVTSFKSEFGGESRTGLLSVSHSDGISEQTLAVKAAKLQWYTGNALVAGREVADKINLVPSMSDQTIEARVETLGEHTAALGDREIDIIVEAARVVELQGGTVPKDSTGQIDVRSAMSISEVSTEVSVIREKYSSEVSTKADGEISAAIGRINNARNVDLLKAQFLTDRKSELTALAGNSEKGESQLIEAIKFLNVSTFAQNTTAKQVGVSRETLQGINTNHVQNTPAVQKSLQGASSFLTELDKNFANYVADKEGEAQANIEYVGKLLDHKVGQPTIDRSSKQEQENIKTMQALTEGSKVYLNGAEVSAKIEASTVGNLDVIKTDDLVDLLRIVVGDGKDASKPGSPTLAAALLDSLATKDSKDAPGTQTRLDDVFAKLRVTNLSATSPELTNGLAAANKADIEAEAVIGTYKSYHRADTAYNAAIEKRAKAATDIARFTKAIQEENSSSNAYVVGRQAVGASQDEINANGALLDKNLVKNFTDNEALTALRVKLGTVAAEKKSVEDRALVDSKFDVI